MARLPTDPRVRAAYAEGAGIYRIVPTAVAIPESVADVQDLVRQAERDGTALVPRGAGSGMPGGNVGTGLVVDLSQGFRTLEVDPRQHTATAGASVTWAQVNDAAGAHGLRLPPDPSSGAFATSGGMVSTNAAGPRTVRFGSVRRWIRALEVVGAGGETRWIRRDTGRQERFTLGASEREMVARTYPRTRKHSAGYGLDAFAASGDELDLFVGAEGTLGIITTVEWRLDPIPAAVAGLTLGFADLAALGEAVPFLLNLNPSAVELLDRTLLAFVAQAGGDVPEGVEGLLLVEFEREQPAAALGAVGDAVRGLKHLAHTVETAPDRAGLEQLWKVRRLASPALARLPETRRSLQVIEDGCVPVDQLGAYIVALRAAAAAREIPVAIFGHAGDGHVHVNALPDVTRTGWEAGVRSLFDEVTEVQRKLGGCPSGEHGIGRLRAGVLERFLGGDVLRLFAHLQRAYDPRSIFNPGVILPTADWSPLAHLKVGDGAATIPDDIAHRLRDIERTAGWATPKVDLARTP
ncbi:MAG: FAD-binding oxidoreductase [Acidobacteriota bacterium]